MTSFNIIFDFLAANKFFKNLSYGSAIIICDAAGVQ